jgi:hypothetical protein
MREGGRRVEGGCGGWREEGGGTEEQGGTEEEGGGRRREGSEVLCLPNSGTLLSITISTEGNFPHAPGIEPQLSIFVIEKDKTSSEIVVPYSPKFSVTLNQ